MNRTAVGFILNEVGAAVRKHGSVKFTIGVAGIRKD
jgi:hypothetical protein